MLDTFRFFSFLFSSSHREELVIICSSAGKGGKYIHIPALFFLGGSHSEANHSRNIISRRLHRRVEHLKSPCPPLLHTYRGFILIYAAEPLPAVTFIGCPTNNNIVSTLPISLSLLPTVTQNENYYPYIHTDETFLPTNIHLNAFSPRPNHLVRSSPTASRHPFPLDEMQIHEANPKRLNARAVSKPSSIASLPFF